MAKKKVQEQVQEEQPDLRDAMVGIAQMFDTIVPPTDLKISDVYGNEYGCRSVLSARAQIVVGRCVKTIMSINVDEETEAKLRAEVNPQNFASVLLTYATNEDVVDQVKLAFEAAQPDVVEKAMANAKSAGKDDDVIDLFAMEDILAGVAPFLIGSVKRTMSMVTGMLGGPQPTT